MLLSVLASSLLMGLLGGTHCVAMCAAPCAMVVGVGRMGTQPAAHGQSAEVALHLPGQRRPALAPHARSGAALWGFHAGRCVGYAALGALAAAGMGQLAWWGGAGEVLRPLWVGLHMLVLLWGLMLLVQGQPPLWLERRGRQLWARVQPWVQRRGGAWLAGVLWALLPCGLLYAAVLQAALAGGAAAGALSMWAFALGSGLWLWVTPWMWRWAQGRRLLHLRQAGGVRLAGGLLVAVALWALWMDVVAPPLRWCR